MGLKRASDPDLIEARATIANLQGALDRAHQRVRELELVAASANQRASEAIEYADAAQMTLLAMQEGTGAMQPNRDVSP